MEFTILVLLAITLYFLPTIIAYQRDHDSMITIFFIDLFLGWTLLGWLACVIWASFGGQPAPRTNVVTRPEEPVEQRVKCPECAELVLIDARKCKHCGSELTPQS